MYVAATRAKEHLTIIHHKTNGYLPFFDTQLITKICDFQGYLGDFLTPHRFHPHLTKQIYLSRASHSFKVKVFFVLQK